MRSTAVLRAVCGLAWFSAAGCYLFHTGPEDRAAAASDPPAPDAGTECAVHSFTSAQKFDPVDMVWVVDSSRSMRDEQDKIRQTIGQFVTDVQQRRFDVRLVMVTNQNIVPAPLGDDTSRFRFVGRAVNSHEPLQALLDTLPAYRDFLRPEADLHFVVVSDDDSRLSADDFLSQMRMELDRPFVVHAVASPDVNGAPCRNPGAGMDCQNASGVTLSLCGAAAIGTQYYSLAERLGGEEISICVDDWSQVFGPLLEAVGRTEIPCLIALGDASEGEIRVNLQQSGASSAALEEVSGADACADLNAYYFYQHALETQLALCPIACGATTLDNAELRVSVGCSAR